MKKAQLNNQTQKIYLQAYSVKQKLKTQRVPGQKAVTVLEEVKEERDGQQTGRDRTQSADSIV